MDKEIKKKMNTTQLNGLFVSLCDEMYCLHVFFSVSSWLQKFTKMHEDNTFHHTMKRKRHLIM